MGEQQKRRKRIPKKVWEVIAFVIAAIVILFLLILLEGKKTTPDIPQLWENIILSVLCSLVASAIFIIIQKVFVDDENKSLRQQLNEIEVSLKRQNALYDSGILSIHPKVHFDKEDDFWRGILANTDNRLDLIGHSISNWFRHEYRDSFCDKIVKIVESGDEVRIVLSGTGFDLQRIKRIYLDKKGFRELNKVEKTLFYLMELGEKISAEKLENLKVYVTDISKVAYLYIRTDYQCIISPYMSISTNNQNSFLLELQAGTEYARVFEDEFIDMLDEMEEIDLFSAKKGVLNQMELLQQYKNNNSYCGSDWNFEETEKFVFQSEYKKYEVGFFEHFKDEQYRKAVIELPVSYGCPSKCKFCASSNIEEFCQMQPEEMMELFEYVYEGKKLSQKEKVLLTLTGTGDLFFNFENVMNFILQLTSYSNLWITVSSCLWNQRMLARIEELSRNIQIRNVQVTYVSDEASVLKGLIPYYESKETNFGELMAYIKNSKQTYYRINYILIQGINDTAAQFQHFKDMIQDVKNKVTVRISMLNETKATKRNQLKPVEITVMKEFNEYLVKEGINSYMFYSDKNDNMNCGQLITEQE